jgi:4-hydroxy 2-oxovalerate aldolase
MRHRFTEEQVRSVVRALDDAGVEVREVSHGDGPGGSSFNYGFSGTDEMKLTAAAVDEAVRARIAVLLLPGVGTVHELKRAYGWPVSAARRGARARRGAYLTPSQAARRPVARPPGGLLSQWSTVLE